MNQSTGRVQFSIISIILLLSACAAPPPAPTQEPTLVQQVIEHSVALTVAAKELQEKDQQLLELSQALTAGSQNTQAPVQESIPNVTTTPEPVETTPEPVLSPTADPNAPTVSEIYPRSGFTAGGDTITIKGTNFVSGDGQTRFFFGDREATNVICLSTTQCTATVPPGIKGEVVIRAERADDSLGTNGSPDTFSYIFLDPEAPVIERIEPREGSIRGGTSVTITGRNFHLGKRGIDPNVTNFYFGKTEAKEVTCSSKEQCKVISPSGIEGYVIVKAENTTEDGRILESKHIPDNDYDGFKYNAAAKYGCSVLTVTPKKGTIFSGQDTFAIRWIVSNTGTNTWPAGIDVKYAGGSSLSGSTVVEIPKALKPNESYEIKIHAVAPENPGLYYTSWIVEGMGCSAYVAITVE